MIRQFRPSVRRAGPALALALAVAIVGCAPSGTGSIKLSEKANPAARPPAEPASESTATAPSGRQLNATDRLPRGNVKKKALENGRP